jgi:membrane protease YdiL (CAAX protease family)
VALVAFVRTALVALAIVFVPQGIWSALIALNLKTTPRIPWAVLLVALVIWIITKRRLPRVNKVPWPVLRWAWLAGACALVALVGYWITLASFVRMPGSVLPDLTGIPWWTVWLAVATGAAISPLCEQTGLWGYWQMALERQFPAPTAIIVTAIAFAVLPHPPLGAVLWPKLIFFFLTGVTFSTMACLTDSILPGLTVHAGSLLTFFVFVWPQDAQRPLIHDAGLHGWGWVHITQAAGFSLLAWWAFRRLRDAHVKVQYRRLP